jgi:hypothetical protein
MHFGKSQYFVAFRSVQQQCPIVNRPPTFAPHVHFHPLQLVACGPARSSQELTGSEDSKSGALGAMTAFGTKPTCLYVRYSVAMGWKADFERVASVIVLCARQGASLRQRRSGAGK